MERIYSGPKLAEIDLELRGPGSLSGTQQHGFVHFKAAKFSDRDIIEKAHMIAKEMVDKMEIEPSQNTALKD